MMGSPISTMGFGANIRFFKRSWYQTAYKNDYFHELDPNLFKNKAIASCIRVSSLKFYEAGVIFL